MIERTHLAFLPSGLPPRTYVSSPSFWFVLVFRGHRIFLTLLWSHGLQVLSLISVMRTRVKRKLVKCAPRAYSELIRSDIPRSSGVRPARLHFLRSSPLSVMKHPVPKSSSPSVSEPLTAKPTQGELRSLLEVLAKKKRSEKRKPPCSPEGSHRRCQTNDSFSTGNGLKRAGIAGPVH